MARINAYFMFASLVIVAYAKNIQRVFVRKCRDESFCIFTFTLFNTAACAAKTAMAWY